MEMKCFPWQAVAKPVLVVSDVERINEAMWASVWQV